MFNREINVRYIHAKKAKFWGDLNFDSLRPIMHVFLMDAGQQLCLKYLNPKNFTHEQKQVLQKLKDAYRMFFKKAWIGFNNDQVDEIGDLMDRFQNDIAHDLYIAKIAIMELDNSKPIEWQEQWGIIYLCNKLALEAQRHHTSCYILPKRKGQILSKSMMDDDIDHVLGYTKWFADMTSEDVLITEKKLDRAQKAASAITNKIILWLQKNYEEEKEKIANADMSKMPLPKFKVQGQEEAVQKMEVSPKFLGFPSTRRTSLMMPKIR